MSNITLYDDFTSFCSELVELLKEDWRKFKLFIIKNKNYCLWILILLITMQFTDLLNIGSSWNRYCNQHDVKTTHIQMRGGAEAPAPSGADMRKKAESESKSKDQSFKDKVKKTLKDDKAQAKKDDIAKDAAKKDIKAQKKADKTQRSSAGPVFGSYDKIAGMVSGMFVIITFILIVIGILSLPVLILIVVTYTILKFMAKKLTVL